MGLDMYLKATKFFWTDEQDKELNEKGKAEKEKLLVIKKLFPEMKEHRLDYIIFEVGYWRKANQIHKWFVDNVQDGKDDCREYDVSREDLEKLKKICEKVIKETKLIEGVVENGYTFEKGKKISHMEAGKVIENPEVAAELLPTGGGFFFGGTDYNEWYLDDIKETVKIIERCLKLPDEWDFSYHSSW
jgi:hypothetical protein